VGRGSKNLPVATSASHCSAVAQGEAFDAGIVVVGAESHAIRDAYHSLLRLPWWGVGLFLVVLTSFANGAFALAYVVTGGIANAAPGSFRDAFFFSVQTMGTIGYGAMYPTSTAAHLVVAAESTVSIILVALATGIVFARFSQSTGRLVFMKKACIAPWDGVPTLMLRVGNDRASTVFEATIRLVAVRTEKTKEGVTFYRMYDLALVRDRSPALQRSWTVMHVIDEKSPLYGMTPERFVADEVELAVSVVGTDDTSLQPVYGRCRFTHDDIVWGARPSDILTELPDGRLQLDVRRFDDVSPTAPTSTFPWPRSRGD